ncbi:hypothetical protein HN51_031981 [Arachis hypogaea]|uniref:START domain-containing protein n=2 Tax=Arachis TaxID=3817 RepID=A0A445B697_ARAHY|nr:uncharacterized protein LOC107469880 [Arachis duranensis]XP_025623279.1 uncharacterized protein LOC112715694 [Arachis hypogaea]XP_057738360.1 uncharacterized protein LOC130955506 [Arachis stenosperma]QHO16258.1 StAR-related lipid transfer protein 7 [Arachis hypogaea]RYR34215.1 hypothetical protein Ahy_A10g048963 isoform B [Arachis hypogaea]
MALSQYVHDMLENPAILGVCIGVAMFLGPIWVAFLFGVLIGWVWKPNWASLAKGKFIGSSSSSSSSSPSKSILSPLKAYASSPSLTSIKMQAPNPESLAVNKSMLVKGMDKKGSSSLPMKIDNSSSALNSSGETSNAVTVEDLHHLWQLVEEKDGGLPWMMMMDRSTPNMDYQAWRREPKDGPPEYRSRTVFEDATPEIVRDLFWDDEFRPRWDDMLAKSTMIQECPTTGTIKVQWIRKFPFFCKDREYIIGRRIFESGGSYYCVTKGIDCPSIPRQDKPRRVDTYYSSWCIRAVESKRAKGKLSACEVILFHHEEMGIPWEIAKIGVKKGMWGTVQKIEPGLRAYQHARASGTSLSRHAFLAGVNTKVPPEYLENIGSAENRSEIDENATSSEKPKGMNIPKILVIGGAIALACSIDRGLVAKYAIFGVARRFANIGRR